MIRKSAITTEPPHRLVSGESGQRRLKVKVLYPDVALKDRLFAGGGVANFEDTEIAKAEALVISPLSEKSRGEPDIPFLESRLEEIGRRNPVHVIFISSALVYGPHSSNPGLMRETFQVKPGNQDRMAVAWSHAEQTIERVSIKYDLRLTILRTCTVVSDVLDDSINSALQARIACSVFGRLPSIQFLSISDLADAITVVLNRPSDDVYNLAPNDAVPVKRAFRIAGTTRLPLPTLLHSVARIRQNPRKFCWTVSSQKFRQEYDFEFGDSSESALLDKYDSNWPAEKTTIPRHDPFGMDPEYIDRCGRGRFWFCEKVYWSIKYDGLEYIPDTGGAVLTGIHRGFMPFDGVMLVHLLNKYRNRIPRFLMHPALVKFGHLDGFLKRIGGVLANQDNANRVLELGQVLGVFPEGIRGAFKKYDKDVYKVGSFGRNDFARFAIDHNVPVIPFVSIGPAESFPIFWKFDWKWWKRFSGWPAFPVTATWPLIPVPLPARWQFRILEPVCPREFGVESSEDRRGIRELSLHVRQKMQTAIDTMRSSRRSIFFGAFPGSRDSEAETPAKDSGA